MKNRFLITSLAALALIQQSCSSIPKAVQAPDVAVQSLDIDKASLTDATVLVTLAVRNPNSFGLKMDSMKYGLEVNGKPFASGSLTDGAKVAGNSESQVTIPLRIKYWDLYNQFSELTKRDVSTYNITGLITSAGHEFPFKHSGEVKFPQS
jgi:LEA14-like dessication related protein